MLICLCTMEKDEDKILFEKIYRKYEKDILRRILRFCKNREDAEDAMQNTWLAVSRNIRFYRDLSETSIKAYLLRIARNQAVSVWRTQRKEADMITEIDAAELSDDSALILACEENTFALIVECIDALDEKYSDVLNLFYLHHHSAKEIADLLHMNENTVRSRIARGKEKLIQLLKRRDLHE